MIDPVESSPESKPCEICSQLTDREYAAQKYGSEENDTYLPAASGRLIVVKDLKPFSSRKLQLWRCPICQRFVTAQPDTEKFRI